MLRRSFLVLPLAAPFLAAFAAPAPLRIGARGRPQQAVVTAPGASANSRAAAAELAAVLEKMVGAPFEVREGDGRQGIAVGLLSEFPGIQNTQTREGTEASRDNYLIRTHGWGALLLGAGESGVVHAVWDFLYRAGFRQFFPGEHWEIVPQLPDLALAIDVQESPSYRCRRIWYSYGAWDHAKGPYRRWTVRNRTAGGTDLQTGHAYPSIIRDLADEFARHPEYFALIAGKRKTSKQAKLCIGNRDLRKLVVRYELEQFRRKPQLDSVSLDPSDGGGWCECADCAAIGPPSNRVVLLANEVAAAVNAEFPGKVVGIYAYYQHSQPPTIRVHPQVVVSVATAFMGPGESVDEIMAGWARQGATLGVREYYSVNAWDRDQPARARGGNPTYLARTIADFHAAGARYLSAESGDNWGPNGLGYYLASRMLWDVRECSRVEALTEDFLQAAFGPAREPMRLFYQALDGARPDRGNPLPQMFRALAQARQAAGDDDAVQARLDDLILYGHYCVLFRAYAKASGAARQDAFEAMIRHAYRMRQTMMVHVLALYRDRPLRDKAVRIPPGCEWNVPEGRNPWKSSAPFGRADLDAFLEDGLRQGAA